MNLQQQERETYETMWSFPQYAETAPGERYVEAFVEMAGVSGQWHTVLDAGCGTGKGAVALQARGFDVLLCDLTADGLIGEARGLPFRAACLWHPISHQVGYAFGGAVDYVYCTDVIEHVPPHLTGLVIGRLLDYARRGVFLSISLVPDHFGVFVGKPLHQSVRSFVEWRDLCAELGRVVECRDLGATGLYLVAPR